jgi:hypothetical protein
MVTLSSGEVVAQPDVLGEIADYPEAYHRGVKTSERLTAPDTL